MFTSAQNFAIVSTLLDEVFFNQNFSATGKYKSSPYAVFTRWEDDEHIVVSAKGFYKLIKAKNNIIDNLCGSSWEGRVREAQQKAFETAYITVREEEKRAYQLGKF